MNDSYDNERMADLDITADRLDLSEIRMSSKEIRHWTGQARLRYDPDASENFIDLRGALKDRVFEMKQQDPEYIEIELGLANLYQRLWERMYELKEVGLIANDIGIPSIYDPQAAAGFRRIAQQNGLHTEVAELDDFLKERKITHKSIRKRLINDAKKKMLEEQKEALKINKSKSTRAVPGRGYQLKEVTKETERISANMDRMSAAAIDILTAEQTEDDYLEEDLDEDTVERHGTHKGGRSQPACWEGLSDEITIRIDRTDGNEFKDHDDQEQPAKMTHRKQRNDFLIAWAMKSDGDTLFRYLSITPCRLRNVHFLLI